MSDTANDKSIRIVTILGTSRPGSYTSHALALVNEELRAKPGVALTAFDPAGIALPFPGEGDPPAEVLALRTAISDADGVVLATPEYHGSVAAKLKLIIENLGFPSALAGKPVALLGVAAGQIGAIKSLEQLRSICSHVGAIVLPGPVSVAGVQQAFDETGNCTDARVAKRVRGMATQLLDYVHDTVCPKMALEEMVRANEAG
ncbi:MAG: NADPH-dependent FMN reductase [Planctomycetota bacterium]